MAPETDLEMAERHVREGERHIALQRKIIATLTEGGHLTDEAYKLLRTFEELQVLHVTHRDRLLAATHRL
jgi:hypothetical protein